MGFLNSIITTIQWTFWALMPNQWRPHMVVPHAKTMVEGKVSGITFEKFARRLRWVVHIIIVVLIVVALWYINWRFDLEKVLHSPWPILHQVWLPLLFLLIYALCWLGWWLWRLLSPDAASDQFPDIDAAWTEALTALSKAGIDPAEVPLVLVLGRPARSMEDLFAAAQLTLPVRHVPRGPDAPVRVYASREAVFVTCEGASLLSRQAELLAGTPVAAAPGAAATNGAAAAPGTDPAAATGLELNPDDLDESGSAPAQTAAQPTAAATAAAAPGL